LEFQFQKARSTMVLISLLHASIWLSRLSRGK
jgi:hypothetical protein